MSLDAPHIKVPPTAQRGETVTLKALIGHPMESGFRSDEAGDRIPRRIVNSLVVTFDGELVIDWTLEPGIAANPYLDFDVTVTRSGTFRFVFTEDGGAAIAAEASITVT